MLIRANSVWLFLDGVVSSHLDKMCIPIMTTDLQKDILKYTGIAELFELENLN